MEETLEILHLHWLLEFRKIDDFGWEKMEEFSWNWDWIWEVTTIDDWEKNPLTPTKELVM